MTDSYDRVENRLVAFEGNEVPEEVHFQVEGIIESREYSPAAWLHAQTLITAAGYPTLQVCTPEGTPINDGPMPEWVAIDDQAYSNLYSPRLARPQRAAHTRPQRPGPSPTPLLPLIAP